MFILEQTWCSLKKHFSKFQTEVSNKTHDALAQAFVDDQTICCIYCLGKSKTTLQVMQEKTFSAEFSTVKSVL